MAVQDLRAYNEILFSAHSCAIEGNTFSVNDTRELKEKGLGVIPQGKTLFEAFEMLDHFRAYEFLFNQPDATGNKREETTKHQTPVSILTWHNTHCIAHILISIKRVRR